MNSNFVIPWDEGKESVLKQIAEILSAILVDKNMYAVRNETQGEKCVNIFECGNEDRVAHVWPKTRDKKADLMLSVEFASLLERVIELPEISEDKTRKLPNWNCYQQISMDTVFDLFTSVPKNESLIASFINFEKLDKAIIWFMNYGTNKKLDSNLSFSDGWLKKEEGYKDVLFSSAYECLEIDSWNEKLIGTGIILDKVVKALYVKNNNIVNYHNKQAFKEIAQHDVKKAERILFHLFLDENPGETFDEACEFWGHNYPDMSFLMTVRDCNEYVPVKTNHHIDRFKKLGIDTSCLKGCNWEHYKLYNDINKEIKQYLEESFGMSLSLLDAHSFIWSLHHADDDLSCEKDSVLDEIINNDDPYVSIVAKGEKEGRVVERYVTKYERSSKNRKAAIKLHGCICAVCGFDFEKRYGIIGKDFIEVHHVKPLYSLDEEVSINPSTDLVCLCSNCHRMIHRKKGGIYTVDELKTSLKMD